jgi:hypothetical protein
VFGLVKSRYSMLLNSGITARTPNICSGFLFDNTQQVLSLNSNSRNSIWQIKRMKEKIVTLLANPGNLQLSTNCTKPSTFKFSRLYVVCSGIEEVYRLISYKWITSPRRPHRLYISLQATKNFGNYIWAVLVPWQSSPAKQQCLACFCDNSCAVYLQRLLILKFLYIFRIHLLLRDLYS